jgi:hypothetical protein
LEYRLNSGKNKNHFSDVRALLYAQKSCIRIAFACDGALSGCATRLVRRFTLNATVTSRATLRRNGLNFVAKNGEKDEA